MSVYPVGTSSAASGNLSATQPTYVVRSGESLQDIADRLGVTRASLLAANPSIRNPDAVYPGTHLAIPESETLAAETFKPHAEPLAPGNGAPADAQVRSSALQTLDKDFSVFDTAAHGGKGDGKISKHDLQKVADDPKYSAQQRAAAKYLLKNGDFYTRLDTAKHGGTPDGTISRNDVNAAKADQSLYENTSAFDGTGSSVSYQPGDVRPSGDDPKSAAVRTEMDRKDGYRDDVGAGGTFARELQAHKNDPAWLKDYFRQLGSKQTAEYLSDLSDPIVLSSAKESDAKQVLADERTALQNMYASGALNDADIGRLVEGWARQSGDPRPGFAQLFAGLDGPQAQSIKNAFAQACAELSLTGQSKFTTSQFTFGSDAGKALSDGDRNQLAAASAYVLSTTSTENQANQLLQLHQEGGNAAVSAFITHAMAVSTQTYGLTSLTTDAANKGQNVPYAGVAQLLKSLANVDPALTTGSKADLVATRDAAFSSALDGLDKHSDNWEKNTTLKDALSKIMMSDFDQLLAASLLPGRHELPTGDSAFSTELEQFAQHVLLTDPTGKLRDASSKFLSQKLGQMIADINTLSPAQIEKKYGASADQVSWLAGQLVAHINTGIDAAVKTGTDKEAAQQQKIDFGLNLLLAAGGDALKLLPGGGVLDDILPPSITGSAVYGTIKGQLEEDLKQGLTDKAYALLLDKLPGLHSDPTLFNLRNTLEDAILTDPKHAAYKGQFQNGYDSVRDK